jgi:7,8-dihydropterin-6-yl-methyl-4-(beta-D-ribofuranosyl)aminobenzene 5'-phosphate synthase
VEPISLEPVDSLTITTLVDNVTDMLLADGGPAKRPPMAPSAYPSVLAGLLEGGRTGDALRAEHGFSCLVTIEKAGRAIRVLFDAGLTPDGLVENMRRLDIPAHDIDIIVPSHCTGWRATHAIAAGFPEAFIQNSVGTRFEFSAAAS